MSLKLKNTLNNVFGNYDKGMAESRNNLALIRQKLSRMYGTTDNQNKSEPVSTETSVKVNGSVTNPKPRSPIKIVESDTTKTSEPSTSKTSESTKATTQSNTGNTIVDEALKYVGTPYVWGGESMSEGGMDCSGYVYNVLKDSGRNVGRDTAEGYRNGGKSVNKSDLQPGDVVFYGKGSATHTGIYIGDGKVAHSSGNSKNTKSNPGKGVIISDLNHRSDYLGARRY